MNTIINKDCIEGLKDLPDNSVDCCVTSPPYFGLRDYGYAEQIGLEQTPELFVAKMVDVFIEVKRVLKKEGTLWLNLGDSYGSKGGDIFTGFNERYGGTGIGGMKQAEIAKSAVSAGKIKRDTGVKAGNLLGIPWKVAFALQSIGYILRQDIIWAKPNPMPESVKNRCTKSHEYIFLLAKSSNYYYDHEAIKVDSKNPKDDLRRYKAQTWNNKNSPDKLRNGIRPKDAGDDYEGLAKANKRSVWTVTTKPFKEAHFATFPPDLIEPCILAGCPVDGVVLDPFMGAGTTAVVAIANNRNYIGFELNAEYIQIANKRIEQKWKELLGDLY